ncbi:energy-coupling factor transporter transmembrane component T family protein [Anaerosporobacter sp.]|uniref:energy-coupling factor transporter transmembrane component T family protein n=1 Tax=Anaerosporobacter sp. TaxID=1872529 RepID=UPI00286EC655|nr:energy-coupling factor transporter transmembrane component T [Anaerosporobacter sp.]
MIRDITIGQYYPKDSFIHKLDPRTKIAGTFIYIISLFLFRKFIPYLIVLGFLGVVIKTSEVPLKHILKGLKSILFLLVFAVVFNIFLTPGDVLWKWGFLKITRQGLETAGFMAIRLVLLIMGSSLMTFTTTPNHLTDGLEKIMNPLKKIKVPVHEISMMMSIALRFIPILLEETDKIMKAQMARGADFESGNLVKKAKSLVPLLVPLFVSAFRRANDLAMAMEARCYRGGEGRTKMKPLQYHKQDAVAYLILVGYLVLLVAVKSVSPF